MSASVTAPHVYRAIHAISAALSKVGIAKTHTNLRDQYSYRSIDDVLAKLAPLLVKNRLCILPRVLSRRTCDRLSEANTVLVSVELLVRYDLVSSRDGSRHTVKAFGEAVDPSDKANAKAMSAAYKSAMLQLFCIPVSGLEEADGASHRLVKRIIATEPVQGWQTWSEDIIEIVAGCETQQALDLMRSRQARLLTAISRERADLYAQIGAAFARRSQELTRPLEGRIPEGNGTSLARRKQLGKKDVVDA